MCGIAGFSLVPNSKINARELANALLTSIESRGNMASGYAWAKADGQHGDYRQAVGGSQLPLKELPRNAKTVILHTRFTTHGPASDNRNNHPVTSPDGKIMLTHNGVIWNEQSLRAMELKEIRSQLPMVDTSVIPALLQVRGLDGLKELQGDAAIAWLDTDTKDVLHLARLQSSPVAYAWLIDGSFVYASTAAHLFYALDSLDLFWIGAYPQPFATMDELDYFKITGGSVQFEKLPAIRTYTPQYYARGERWRDATSGGHESKSSTTTQRAIGTGKTSGSEAAKDFLEGYDYDAQAEEWYDKNTGQTVCTKTGKDEYIWNGKVVKQTSVERRIDEVIGTGEKDPKTDRYIWKVGGVDVVWSDVLQNIVPLTEVDEMEKDAGIRAHIEPMALFSDDPEEELDFQDMIKGDGKMSEEDRFYTMDHDGDYQGYRTFQAWFHALVWHAGLTGGAYEGQLGAMGEEKWIEHFQDTGFVLGDTLVSYVAFPEMTFEHDDDYDGGLGFVRSGAALLERLMA
jgi:hypothetical protein